MSPAGAGGAAGAEPEAGWRRIKVDSWRGYQDAIEDYLDGDWLFRGVTSVEHKLIPSIGRGRPDLPYSEEMEKDLFKQFKREAIPLLPVRPQNDWEWLALAQHFGVPTRLLDWSETHYVSLFFAVWGNDEQDAGLYIIRKPAKIPNLEEERDPFAVEDVSFFYPGYVTARLVSQRGLFTLHPDPSKAYSHPDMLQIVIDRDSKPEFRRKLDTTGVHHGTIYADLDGLSRRLVSTRAFRSAAGRPAAAASIAPAALAPEEQRKKVNPVDPQKGQWGGLSRRNGWALTATVEEISDNWFRTRLRVEADPPGSKALEGPVVFHLHDTFEKPVRKVEAVKNVAKLKLASYGAFTVGAVVKDDGTPLELDLADLETAPLRFRQQ